MYNLKIVYFCSCNNVWFEEILDHTHHMEGHAIPIREREYKTQFLERKVWIHTEISRGVSSWSTKTPSLYWYFLEEHTTVLPLSFTVVLVLRTYTKIVHDTYKLFFVVFIAVTCRTRELRNISEFLKTD